MKLNKLTEQIGDFIGKNQLSSAIKIISDALKGSTMLDEAIVQSARYTDLMKKIRNGQISFEDENITKNKIRFALLDLVREIESHYEENPAIQSEVDALYKNKESAYKIYIEQRHEGNGDNIAGDQINYH